MLKSELQRLFSYDGMVDEEIAPGLVCLYLYLIGLRGEIQTRKWVSGRTCHHQVFDVHLNDNGYVLERGGTQARATMSFCELIDWLDDYGVHSMDWGILENNDIRRWVEEFACPQVSQWEKACQDLCYGSMCDVSTIRSYEPVEQPSETKWLPEEEEEDMKEEKGLSIVDGNENSVSIDEYVEILLNTNEFTEEEMVKIDGASTSKVRLGIIKYLIEIKRQAKVNEECEVRDRLEQEKKDIERVENEEKHKQDKIEAEVRYKKASKKVNRYAFGFLAFIFLVLPVSNMLIDIYDFNIRSIVGAGLITLVVAGVLVAREFILLLMGFESYALNKLDFPVYKDLTFGKLLFTVGTLLLALKVIL